MRGGGDKVQRVARGQSATPRGQVPDSRVAGNLAISLGPLSGMRPARASHAAMLSLLHEGLLELLRHRPRRAVDLVREVLYAALPPFERAGIAESNLTQLQPTEPVPAVGPLSVPT